MHPHLYLKFAIEHKAYRHLSWLLSVLAVTRTQASEKDTHFVGELVREPYGLFFYDKSLTPVKLEVTLKENQPLFRAEDPVTLERRWVPSLPQETLESTLGNLLVNLICLYEAFGAKFPYKTGRFTPATIEAIVAPLLTSTPSDPETPRDPKKFYVDEYLKFCQGVSFLESLSSAIAHSVTEVGLLPPPGRQAFKKELLKKYQGKLADPVYMSAFEEELSAFDDAYLKQDPAYGKFMSGKVKAARRSLFLTQGGENNGFTGALKVTPNVSALEEGIQLDPETFTAMANSVRYSSFARGAETVNGGVTAKALMRAADNWEIVEGDCGTPYGIHRLYRKGETKGLVGRTLIDGKTLVYIEDEAAADAYAGREIIVRSPQYCRQEGTKTCTVCAGEALSKYPKGLPIPLMEVSGGILKDSLKVMHNSKLITQPLSLPSAIT